MATYSRPGVYVNELATSTLVTAPTGGTAAVFFGEAKKGPTTATLINDWTTYKSIYGDLENAYDLGYAVYHYFANGGRSAYVVRAAAAAAVNASATVWYSVNGTTEFAATSDQGDYDITTYGTTDPAATTYEVGQYWTVTDSANPTTISVASDELDGFVVSDGDYIIVTNVTSNVPTFGIINKMFTATATSSGTWGNDIDVKIEALNTEGGAATSGLVETGAGTHGTFTVVVLDGTTEVERWTGVSLDPNSSRYIATLINEYSRYVDISAVSTLSATAARTYSTTAVSLASGAAGTVADSDYTNAGAAIDKIDTIAGTLLLNAPGKTNSNIINSLLAKAAARGDSFVIIDPSLTDTSVGTHRSTATYTGNAGYGAVYAPALKMIDPAKTGPGAVRTTYPGGAVAGLFVRTEVQRGVAKAPAGFSADIRGALGTAWDLSDTNIGELYDGSPYINPFKVVPGGGIVALGARTMEDITSDKFIPVRRTLNYVKDGLKQVTNFAVFEANNEDLWVRVTNSVGSFLSTLYNEGGLKGSTASNAFYVVCDSTNNTAATIDQGIVNIEVGVALQYPAEFVVINISQWTGGSNVVETV